MFEKDLKEIASFNTHTHTQGNRFLKFKLLSPLDQMQFGYDQMEWWYLYRALIRQAAQGTTGGLAICAQLLQAICVRARSKGAAEGIKK